MKRDSKSSVNQKTIIIKALIGGILGALGLFIFYYIVLFAVTKDPLHPINQMRTLQPWMGLLIAGFGIQISLYLLVRSGVRLKFAKQDSKDAGAVAGTGAAISGVSMAACCAHHLVEIVPIIGLSGLAIFLTEYQQPLLIFGVIANAFGILFMTWTLLNREKPGVIFKYFFRKGVLHETYS